MARALIHVFCVAASFPVVLRSDSAVTGLKPRLPSAMKTGIPVEMTTVDAYVKDLLNHLAEVHSSAAWTTLAAIEKHESALGDRFSMKLQVSGGR